MKLIPNSDPPFGLFGNSVSIADQHAAVGGSADLNAWPVFGTAYVFTEGEAPWSNLSELRASDNRDSRTFGRAVATDGARLVVGAPAYPGPGAAYLFVRPADSWLEQRRFVASDLHEFAILGVAVGGNYAFASTYEAVYVYVLPSAANSFRNFSNFQTCFGGEEPELDTKCAEFDLAPDGRIDLRDFNELLATLAGP
jgi:hypothetical protein